LPIKKAKQKKPAGFVFILKALTLNRFRSRDGERANARVTRPQRIDID